MALEHIILAALVVFVFFVIGFMFAWLVREINAASSVILSPKKGAMISQNSWATDSKTSLR